MIPNHPGLENDRYGPPKFSRFHVSLLNTTSRVDHYGWGLVFKNQHGFVMQTQFFKETAIQQ